MNTPPTPKRYDPQIAKDAFREKASSVSGHYSLALTHIDTAVAFSVFVTSFTHLEHWMEKLAANLMGCRNDVASIAMRTVVSIQARIEMMEALLERARTNADKPVEFDEILREFRSLRNLRNDVVHGQWQTNDQTGEVKIIRPRSDPYLLDTFAYEPFDIEDLKKGNRRITNLIIRLSWAIAQEEVKAKPKAPAPQSDASADDPSSQTPPEGEQPPPQSSQG